MEQGNLLEGHSPAAKMTAEELTAIAKECPMKTLLLLICLAAPALAQADIFKCERAGKVTYQSIPCPPEAAEEDVSRFERSQRMYSGGNRYQRPDADDYREYRDRLQRRQFQYNRREAKRENQDKRDRAVAEARRQSNEEKRKKEAWDRRLREDKIRRKARNSGNYEYWDINVR